MVGRRESECCLLIILLRWILRRDATTSMSLDSTIFMKFDTTILMTLCATSFITEGVTISINLGDATFVITWVVIPLLMSSLPGIVSLIS